jgi:aspartyl protease family protein
MWAAAIIVALIIAAIVAWMMGSDTVAGFDPAVMIPAVAMMLMATALLGGVMQDWRGKLGDGLKAIAGWMAILVLVLGGYAYRFEFASVGNRIVGTIIPGLTLFGSGGEVTVSRGTDTHFAMTMQINGQPMRIMFDTGASSIVLKADDAARLGIKLTEADYTVTVRTANGTTRAAPITLRSVQIGGIREDNVRAMVAQPGQLFDNLLGMTFLERLSSYEVKGDQLILRGRGQ